MKKYVDLKRKEMEFEEGKWVSLKLQPYRQQSIVFRKSLKLSKRFYGPYKIIQKIGIAGLIS